MRSCRASAASPVSSSSWRASRIMATEVEIRAPAEQTEGTRSQVLRWLKAVGDEVAQNEPLLELETDKVTVEVAAPGSGVLREILKREQEDVAPGDLLGRIGVDGASAGPSVSVMAGASVIAGASGGARAGVGAGQAAHAPNEPTRRPAQDRKSTRLNSSHPSIAY